MVGNGKRLAKILGNGHNGWVTCYSMASLFELLVYFLDRYINIYVLMFLILVDLLSNDWYIEVPD